MQHNSKAMDVVVEGVIQQNKMFLSNTNPFCCFIHLALQVRKIPLLPARRMLCSVSLLPVFNPLTTCECGWRDSNRVIGPILAKFMTIVPYLLCFS